MKQTLFLLLLFSLTATTLGLIRLALAQGSNPPALSSNALLDERFELCTSNPLCTTEEKLGLMKDMTDNMHESLQYIRQSCVDKKYRNCVNPQMGEVLQWHTTHNRMRDIMRDMESQYIVAMPDTTVQKNEKNSRQLNLLEPAAGPTPNPYTKPDQEQMERQKQDWWKSWSPSGESNPYHKW